MVARRGCVGGKVGRGVGMLEGFETVRNQSERGTMKGRLAASLEDADRVFCYKGRGVNWDPAGALLPLGGKASTFSGDIDALAQLVASDARPGDTVLCMSNGSFGGICGRILEHLKSNGEGR